MDTTQMRLLWVTNLMPPYRQGLWTGIGGRVNLEVHFVEGDDLKGMKSIRNEDWTTRRTNAFRTFNIPTIKIRRKERVFHFTLRMIKIAGVTAKSDVVILGGWESPVYWQYLLLSKIFRKPSLLFHESTDYTSLFRSGFIYKVKKYIFSSVDAVIVPGVASRESVRALGVPHNKVYEGFNAVDMDHFRDVKQVRERPSQQVPAAEGHRYIYVGQFIKRKRVAHLVSEFARVREAEDTLTLVGKGPEEKFLRHLVDYLQLHEFVSFLGEVRYGDLPGVLHQHHTLILPSQVEVWGLVVNEGLAAGLHAVVAKQCGVAQSVQGMRGVFIWDEDENSLGESMVKSAESWSGAIYKPEILEFTNARFAETVLKGVNEVAAQRE